MLNWSLFKEVKLTVFKNLKLKIKQPETDETVVSEETIVDDSISAEEFLILEASAVNSHKVLITK